MCLQGLQPIVQYSGPQIRWTHILNSLEIRETLWYNAQLHLILPRCIRGKYTGLRVNPL